tara:strand:+ start:10016 stop:11206 length:1191 start_codon:yes stop_codon:yes gene_type:complete
MAFKFKVKKRPNLAQAVAGAFTQGAVQGGQAALQKMIKDREDLKQQSTKELNTFNNLAAGLVQTPKNRQAIVNGRLAVMKGSPALETFEALDIGNLDYQTEKEKEDAFAKAVALGESAEEVKEKERTSFAALSKDPEIVAAEIKARQSMVDPITGERVEITPKPPESVVKQRIKEAEPTIEQKYPAYNIATGETLKATEGEVEGDSNLQFGTPPSKKETKKYVSYNVKTNEVLQSTEDEVESNPDLAFGTPDRPTPLKKYQAFKRDTGEIIMATEREVESDPNKAFGTPKSIKTKKAKNLRTGKPQFVTEEEIQKSSGNLVPYINQPAFISLLEDIPEGTTVVPNQVIKERTVSDALSGAIQLAPGDSITDKDLGTFIFKGGDQNDLSNYDMSEIN